jgi:hypothetical protein
VSTTGARLTQALVDLLSKVVPEDFVVKAHDGILIIGRTSGGLPTEVNVASIVDQDKDDDLVRIGALSALSAVQDVVSEGTGEPWPRKAGARSIPAPQAEIDGSALCLWYGTGRDVVTDVGRIGLATLA